MVLNPEAIPCSPVHWHPCYRIIPSRFPPISLFEDIADPADLEAVFRVESLTNDRLREEVGELRDLRGQRADWPEVHDPEDYTRSQSLARRLRAEDSWGITYDSVRHPGGECAAVFRPRAISHCRQAEHLGYVWNGERITLVYEKRVLRH